MMSITICGGGNLGHVCAGFLSAQGDSRVSLLTSKPERWSEHIDVRDCDGRVYHGTLSAVSDRPSDVIPQADVVLLCLPGFAIRDVLRSVAPCLRPSAWVGSVVSSTGFFFEAEEALPASQPLFGFQRVPFISRITRYGREAELKGYKESLAVAVEHTADKETVRAALQQLFKTPVRLLSSHYEVSLSNSNPLLHTSRLYTLWRDWTPGITYASNPGFYSDWTVGTSELYIAMDEELQRLLRRLGVGEDSIPTVLHYYDSWDAESLTRKISSIPAFQGILSPMTRTDDGTYVPDFTSRYFTEDFPYGLKPIHTLCQQHGIDCPNIEQVLSWGMSRV